MDEEKDNYCIVSWDKAIDNSKESYKERILKMLLYTAFKHGQKEFGTQEFYIKIEYYDSRVEDSKQ
jgi:hypothetical protein